MDASPIGLKAHCISLGRVTLGVKQLAEAVDVDLKLGKKNVKMLQKWRDRARK